MYLTANGIKIYYKKIGVGAPLIMVHCNSMSHSIFNSAAKVLSKHYTIYLPDSRDHGKSQKVKTLHYDDMVQDIYCFITELGIEKPIFYGFSDGGIIGLLLAAKYPNLLSALIVSGASLNPDSTKERPMKFFKFWSHIDRSDKMQLMMREPNITDKELSAISVPTFVTAGENDVIKPDHTEHIYKTIPNAKLKIFPKTGHTGYIVNSTKIAKYILSVCNNINNVYKKALK